MCTCILYRSLLALICLLETLAIVDFGCPIREAMHFKDFKFVLLMFGSLGFWSQIPLLRTIFHGWHPNLRVQTLMAITKESFTQIAGPAIMNRDCTQPNISQDQMSCSLNTLKGVMCIRAPLPPPPTTPMKSVKGLGFRV